MSSQVAPLAATHNQVIVSSMMEANEYGYGFIQSSNKNWMGPSHWQPPTTSRTVTTAAATGVKATRKIEKAKFCIDFNSEVDWKKKFARGRTSNVLTAATIDKQAAIASSLLLPDDIHYTIENLMQLFTKPQCKVYTVVIFLF